MSIQPIFPLGTMLAVFAVLFGVTAYLVIKNKAKTGDRIGTLVSLTIIYVLALIIGMRPVMVETK